jgi:hypothetical protein
MIFSYKRTRRRSSPGLKPQAGINAVIRAPPLLLQRGEWAVASYRRRGIVFAARHSHARRFEPAHIFLME